MSKIKITILGTTAGVPTRERAHAAIHLSYDDGEEFCYLFDCGEGTQRQFMVAGLNMMKIDDVFITHWHGDHCLGLTGMVDTMGFEGRARPLTVYAPEAQKIKKCLDLSSSIDKYKVITRNVPARGKRITTQLETERFRIVSTPVKHGVPAVAFALIEKDKTCIDPEKAKAAGLPEKGEFYGKLKEKGEIIEGGRRITLEEISFIQKGKKVVYSGDTEICENLKNLAGDADLLIQDCTYFDKMDKEKSYMHPTLPDVIEMARDARVKKTVLTHISRKYQDVPELQKMIAGYPDMEVAVDFMTVET
ncbi:MBL fold metallo-hydrolase [Candidatus Omnitrophota bacterium]